MYVCELYIKIDSNTADDLLDFIDEQLDLINANYVLEFIVIDNDNISAMKVELTQLGIHKLPSLLCEDELYIGNREICEFLVPKTPIRKKSNIMNDDDVHNTLIGYFDKFGGHIDDDEEPNHMEKITKQLGSTGLSDTGKFSEVLSRARIGGMSFNTAVEARRRKLTEYNEGMRGDRVTAGRGKRKPVKYADNDQTQSTKTSIAYRGDESERTVAMSKPEVSNPEASKSHKATKVYMNNERDVDEEGTSAYDKYVGTKIKTDGRAIKARLESGRRSKSNTFD